MSPRILRHLVGLPLCFFASLSSAEYGFSPARNRGDAPAAKATPASLASFIDYARNGTFQSLCGPNRSTTLPTPVAAVKDPLAARVEQIFTAQCRDCHNKGSTDGSSKFQDILDVSELARKGILVPRQPEISLLMTALTRANNPMPKDADPLSAEEKRLVSQWIAQGAPDFAPEEKYDIGFVSEGDKDECVLRDFRAVPDADKPHQRYLTLNHLYNGGRQNEIKRVSQAIVKLLNSLSWNSKLHGVETVDTLGMILRLDLRHFSWNENSWNELVGKYPYGNGSLAARGDWFVFAASRPPLYHDLLGLPGKNKKPGADAELEKFLGVDIAANIESGTAKRAGTRQSGVSSHNRIIERHFARNGSYWKSYDFKTNDGNQNIFDHPLDFQKNGGEIIFSLPNGLQGYLLTDDKGVRIDSGPTEIVTHKKRPEGGFAVVNGLSCFECHVSGMNRIDDQIRKHVVDHPDAFSRDETGLIFKLFPEKRRMDALFEVDETQFRKAIEAMGVEFKPKEEPIFATSQKFEAALDEATAAAEVSVTLDDFRSVLSQNPTLKRRLALTAAFSVDRVTFDKEFSELLSSLQRQFARRPKKLPVQIVSNQRPVANAGFQFVSLHGKVAMQTTEVTQAQWTSVLTSLPPQPAQGASLPVVNVSLDEVLEFLQALNQQSRDGFRYRLPTEGEWELGARAGSTTAYSFGDDVAQLDRFAWFDENAKGPQPVGSKAPNGLGLYDVHGNVFEWVNGVFGNGTAGKKQFVVRGGSWRSGASRCKSGNRGGQDSDKRTDFVGFRLVRE